MNQTYRIRATRFATSLSQISNTMSKSPNCNIESHGNEIIIHISTNKTKEILEQIFANIIANDCKRHYITTKIHFKISCELMHFTFIQALCQFDYQTDKFIARTLLEIGHTFDLDSFYDFCLDKLKKRWDEVITIANDNMPLLLCRQTFTELLSYLLTNLESKIDTIILKEESGKINVYDRSLKPIMPKYTNQTLCNDKKIIATLISLSPRKILFFGNHPLFETISLMFGTGHYLTNYVTSFKMPHEN
ncbi:MAG: putative sporulation protein YtxC [Firmicutes bacterium]|nr:putative sporulation protein YtxC [Bacillota bacterium]